MKKKNILITAGPTLELIDPVRYISNFSTGTLGFLIAKEAIKKGYNTYLVTGPVNLRKPEKAKVSEVTTAREMQKEVKKHIKKMDCIIMTSAVCDFRPKNKARQKIKKKNEITIELVKNPDILNSLKNIKGIYKVGFALETSNARKNAMRKKNDKKVDLLVLNKITPKNNPFGPDKKETNGRNYIMINEKEEVSTHKNIKKTDLAKIIMRKVRENIG